MSTRNILIGLVLVFILGAGFIAAGGSQMLVPKPAPTPVPSLDELENLITASGTLLPPKHASLAFKIAGPTAEEVVKAGEMVKRGDLLVRLEAAELEAAVSQAQAAQALAEADLNQLLAGASQQDIAAARANIDTAQAQLAQLRAPSSREEVAIAKAGLDRAEAALRDAQSAYDRVRSDPAVGMLPQSAALQLAFQEYQIAEARYNQVLKGPRAEDIRVGEAGVAAAQANLEQVTAAARPEALAVARARVDQASAGLRQAQAALASATMLAPFDGLIASVNVSEGEVVTPGVPVVVIGDVTKMRLETDDLGEANIAQVRIGQPVDVAFEALPEQSFKGKVTEIAPISSAKQGGTNYTVFIELDTLDPALRWGMTGHVEIKAQ